MSRAKLFFVIIICITILDICCKSNRAPDIPTISIGPDSGNADNHTFFSFTFDPDGDSVAIKFDWGDGNESNWSPFVGSGDTVSMTHFYEKMGSYEIRVKAKDIHNAESDWSESHLLTVGTEFFWFKEYGGSGDEFGYGIQKSQDNAYVIVGSTNSYGAGGDDIYLIKIDSSGNSVWEKTYGSNYTDHGYAVEILPDNKYVATGYVTVNAADIYYIIINGNGNLIKEKSYGDYNYEYGRGIVIDGDYCVIGSYKRTNLWRSNIYAMKIKI